MRILDAAAIRRALEFRDLTDPARGTHAMQRLLDAVEAALAGIWEVPVQRHRDHPVVSVAANYDQLGYPPDGAARDARYTRYLNAETVLRTMTSVMVPPLLTRLAAAPLADVVLSCPGLCYRRDAIDRYHVGEPHQVDLWRVRTVGSPLDRTDLREMIAMVVEAALPGARWRVTPAVHPYTTDGLQIDADVKGTWVEIGECGLVHPELLARCGLDPVRVSGLAMGVGLDRLVMLCKGLDDIRLLRSDDRRVVAQMVDLAPYRPVSSMPPIRRDLSIAVAETVVAEELGDRVRSSLGDRAGAVEAVEILAETPLEALPEPARARLGIGPGQKNVLLRVILRDLDRTLTDDEANVLRDDIYAAVHEGRAHTWARDHPPGMSSPAPVRRGIGTTDDRGYSGEYDQSDRLRR